MRTRVLPLTGLLALAGVLVLLDGGKGRTQQQPPVPDFLKKMQTPDGRPAFDNADLVKEFLVTPQAGAWMICLASYSGPEAAKMARDFVLVLRDPKGSYKMNAYVFNRGAEERKKEQQRVEQVKQQALEKYKLMGMEPPPRMRVPRIRSIEDQYAVLVGSFKDMPSARRQLDGVRKLPLPDPAKVKMDSAYIIDPKSNKGESAWINPFLSAFVVPNPTAPPPAAGNNIAWDPFLRDLNANESYSLLKSPRAITLLVKQYQGAALVQPQTSAGGSIGGKIGTGKDATVGATLDRAGQSAHNLAEEMRRKLGLDKMGLEPYVLHTRYYSMVTVGSFEEKDTERIHRAQETWARMVAQMNPQLQAQVQWLPQALPLRVPRP
jgi:hypothetical protein